VPEIERGGTCPYHLLSTFHDILLKTVLKINRPVLLEITHFLLWVEN
jgi:hypothetical protein